MGSIYEGYVCCTLEKLESPRPAVEEVKLSWLSYAIHKRLLGFIDVTSSCSQFPLAWQIFEKLCGTFGIFLM
jgi:hypothetical protein